MKHTPGPWQRIHDHPHYNSGYNACVWGPKGPGFGLVADCDHSGLTEEECIANAQLVAAAPELLEACKEALLQIEYMQGKFNETGTGNATCARLYAVIKKAQGE